MATKTAAPAATAKSVADVLGKKPKQRPSRFNVAKDSPRVNIPTGADIEPFVARGHAATGNANDEYVIVVDGSRQTGILLDAVCYALAGGVIERTLVEQLLALKK